MAETAEVDFAAELDRTLRELSNARNEVGHWRQRAEKAERELRILSDTYRTMRERVSALRHEHGVLLDELTNRTMERDGARAQRDALLELVRAERPAFDPDLLSLPPSRWPGVQAAEARLRELGVDL